MSGPFTVLSGHAISPTSPPNLIMVEYDPQRSARVPFGEKIVLVQAVGRLLDGTPLLPSEFYGAGAGFDWKDATCLTGVKTRGMSIDGGQLEPAVGNRRMKQRQIAASLPILAARAIGCGHRRGDTMSTRESAGREPGAWPRTAPIHAKLTYLGPQEKPVASVVLYEGEAPPDDALFQRHQSAGIDYANDSVGNARARSLVAENVAATAALATVPLEGAP